MKTMNLMAVLALVAAAHSISTRTASAGDAPAPAIRTFDLPTVRVHATVEREAPAVAQAPRIHDLPAVQVHAPRGAVDARMAAVAGRAAARRHALAIPRGGLRRGLMPERATQLGIDDRGDRWMALGCMIRLRLARVWPMQGCNSGASQHAAPRPRANAAMLQASLGRRR